MITRLTVLTFALALFACEREKAAVLRTDTSGEAGSEAQKSAPPAAGFDFEPPPTRLAVPTGVLDMRLRGAPVGTFVDRDYPDGVPLQAFGLNLCQTGWIAQGFLRRDDNLVATPPLPINLPTIPTGSPVQHRHEGIDGRTMRLDFSRASMTQLKGELSIVDDTTNETIMSMVVDGEPVGIASGPGLGARGCFTTGYWQMSDGGQKLRGPVTAVWDEERLYYVGLRLTEQHGLGLWFFVKPTHRQPQYVIRGDLAAVAEKPKTSPFRVVFETRRRTDTGMTVDETPATTGQMKAAFLKAHPKGPLRVELEDLEFPRWDGPMSGRVVEQVRLETLVVTDIDGSGVPLPVEPNFGPFQETQQERPNPDAPVRVTPDHRDEVQK